MTIVDCNKLSVFIPTYNRPEKLMNLVDNIEIECKKSGLSMNIYISDNSEEYNDELIKEYQNSAYVNIKYFKNDTNIGIDSNHDKVYDFCCTEYCLFMADDDLLIEGSINKILQIIEHKDALVLFFNGYCNNYPHVPIYNLKDTYIEGNGKDLINFFLSGNICQDIIPLLPFYSGIVVNISMISSSLSKNERDRFSGTLHQYLGSIWNTMLKYNSYQGYVVNECITMIDISSPVKSWTGESYQLYVQGIPSFYDALLLDDENRNIIKNYYNYNYKFYVIKSGRFGLIKIATDFEMVKIAVEKFLNKFILRKGFSTRKLFTIL